MLRLFVFLGTSLILVIAAGCANRPTPAPATPQPARTQVVNPATATPAPANPANTPAQPQNGGLADLNQFSQKLAQAAEKHDFAALRALMGDPFAMAGWRSEGRKLSADEAMNEIRSTHFGPGSKPAAAFGQDPAALLEGADPLAIMSPDGRGVRAFYMTGLGSQAADEALLIIARDPDTGRFYWHGILIAMGGFRPAGPGIEDVNQFNQDVAKAVEARDFAMLRSLMKDRFSIATWNTQLLEFSSEEALEKLQAGPLANGATPAVRFGTDVTALLSGTDPLSLWGPVAQPVSAMHVMGLGSTGTSEAVLVIARDAATGKLYLHGILLPPDEYFQPVSGPFDVVATDVQYVMANEDVNLRAGPGTNYDILDKIFAGMTAQVTGKSKDGKWWRVPCQHDASGFCWLSSDPALTTPVTK